MSTSVKRSAGSTSPFQAEENGNSWSIFNIFNIFRHWNVCIAHEACMKLHDPQLRSPVHSKFYLLRPLGQGKVPEVLSGWSSCIPVAFLVETSRRKSDDSMARFVLTKKLLSVLNFKAQFGGRLAVWSVINNHLRSPHKSISTFPFLLKPSSIYNVASIRTGARPCRFRRICYFREVR